MATWWSVWNDCSFVLTGMTHGEKAPAEKRVRMGPPRALTLILLQMA
jgi:hypothetical protein